MKLLKSQSSPYHSLKQAMQPSLLVCGTVGHISYEHYRILQNYLSHSNARLMRFSYQHVTDHTVTKVERDLLVLPVSMVGPGITDPVVTSSSEYERIKVTNRLVRRIVEQQHQPLDASEIRTLQLTTLKQKDDCLSERLERVKNSLPTKAKRAVDLASDKGS